MRSWTTKEARQVLEWARTPLDARTHIKEIAGRLGRSAGSVQQFLRRVLPREQWPWVGKPRWAPEEIEALENDRARLNGRSPAAINKYVKRHCGRLSDDSLVNEESERTPLTVTQVAEDLGVSRASVYRLLNKGVLRRFKGGIAGTSFSDLLREHPEAVPYSRLPRDHKEWLVLNGYFDASLSVKPPSTKGLLD